MVDNCPECVDDEDVGINKYANGKVWEDRTFNTYTIQYIDLNRWGLLSTPYTSIYGGNSMIFKVENGKMFYTKKELIEKLETWTHKENETIFKGNY